MIVPQKAYSWFGTDAAMMIPYLIEIIAKSVKTYMELKKIYDNAKEQKEILKAINEGLNSALNLLDGLPIKDENILGELKNFRKALNEVENVYGDIPKGPDADLHLLQDQTVAESFKIANLLKEYAEQQEKNARKMDSSAGGASPKGAQRMTLQANAAILHTLNQILRVNGQMLKLQGEQLAMMNKGDKDSASHYNRVNEDMKASFKGFSGSFKTPKFNND